MFDRTLGRWFYPLHRRLYGATDGAIGGKSPMGPMLLLTTTGRRSGEDRTTPLLYMADGADMVVVGSNGGRDQAPAWVLNLRADPSARVQVGARVEPVRAHFVLGDEADELWPRLSAQYSGWQHYQELTTRRLPVVRLEPLERWPVDPGP